MTISGDTIKVVASKLYTLPTEKNKNDNSPNVRLQAPLSRFVPLPHIFGSQKPRDLLFWSHDRANTANSLPLN